VLDVSIVIVSYYSGRDLPPLIRSIDDAAGALSWHATVVNNTTDESLAHLSEDDRVTVVEAGANLGYSGGLNLGLTMAPEARVTVFLNPDLVLRTGALTALVAAVDGGSDAAVPRILDATGVRQDSLRREPTVLSAFGEAVFGDAWARRPQLLAETVRRDRAYRSEHAIEWATGATLAVRADVVAAVGAWDADRFFLYSEETDYCRRIRSRGGSIAYVPDSVVQHRGGGSGTSPHLDALLEVNKLRYFQKWHGPWAAGAFGTALLLRNAIRPHRPGARAAVRALLSSRARAELPGGPR